MSAAAVACSLATAPPGHFSLSISRTSATLKPGDSTTATISHTREFLTSGVHLQVVIEGAATGGLGGMDPPPDGVFGTLSSSSLTTESPSATLKIKVASNAQPGGAGVRVYGTAGGMTRSVVVALTISAP